MKKVNEIIDEEEFSSKDSRYEIENLVDEFTTDHGMTISEE
jgi:hypothetical protein